MNAVAAPALAKPKKTATKSTPPAQPPAAAPGANPEERYLMPVSWYDSIATRLEHASTILSMLVHIFTGDEVEEPKSVPGLMGTVQHVKWLLGGLSSEIMEITNELPGDLRWRTYEASELIDVFEWIEFDSGFKFDSFTDEFICSYFNAALEAVKLACKALNQVETTP